MNEKVSSTQPASTLVANFPTSANQSTQSRMQRGSITQLNSEQMNQNGDKNLRRGKLSLNLRHALAKENTV